METLVMPMNYVELQEDEMTYLDAGRFYMSNQDLRVGIFSGLASAAYAGPVALATAWTAISSVALGPLGTIGGLAAGLLGMSFFAELGGKIIGALVEGKGLALYPKWGWPPLDMVIE